MKIDVDEYCSILFSGATKDSGQAISMTKKAFNWGQLFDENMPPTKQAEANQ